MNDFLAFTVFVVLMIGGIVGVVAVGEHHYGKYQCENFQKITGKQTQYAAFDMCYIKTESGWERYDEYMLRGTSSEGLKALNEK